jgi:hypothetical protein
MKMNNVFRFIKELKIKCKKYNVKLILYNQKYIEEDGEKFGGWFDPIGMELHCAFPDKIQSKYVEVLIHESCHMDQWIENTKYWSIERENNSLDEFWKILKGIKVKNLKFHLRNVQMMEAECEEMAIEKIKYYDMGINITKYSQKANSYLLFYSLLKETKKWADYAPYKYGTVWRKMSTKILSRFELDNEMKFLLITKCYKKRTLKKLQFYQDSNLKPNH